MSDTIEQENKPMRNYVVHTVDFAIDSPQVCTMTMEVCLEIADSDQEDRYTDRLAIKASLLVDGALEPLTITPTLLVYSDEGARDLSKDLPYEAITYNVLDLIDDQDKGRMDIEVQEKIEEIYISFAWTERSAEENLIVRSIARMRYADMASIHDIELQLCSRLQDRVDKATRVGDTGARGGIDPIPEQINPTHPNEKEVSTMTTTQDATMKTYIGTKIVKMQPMNRLEYNELRGWTVPADEDPADEGYLVEYLDGGKPNLAGFDGYVSWSPKAQAEAAYREVNGLPFSMALEALQKGKKVTHPVHVGEEMWLEIIGPFDDYYEQEEGYLTINRFKIVGPYTHRERWVTKEEVLFTDGWKIVE